MLYSSIGFDKCVMSCVHYYSVMQNSVTTKDYFSFNNLKEPTWEIKVTLLPCSQLQIKHQQLGKSFQSTGLFCWGQALSLFHLYMFVLCRHRWLCMCAEGHC